jgi:hypothetical protein
MRAIILILLFTLVLVPFQSIESRNSDAKDTYSIAAASAKPVAEFAMESIRNLYQQFPASSFSWEAFRLALTGLTNMNNKTVVRKPDLLTIIDFSKPSTQKRLFVIDLKQAKILYSSLVAHGRNSGENYATSFSNQPESYQSSLGFFMTAETYHGKHGLSLRLDGLEKGINDKARDRAIVIHGADYVSERFAQAQGRLGRSQGCPALPMQLNAPVINSIQGGSVLFIYAPQKSYLASSTLLKETEADCMLDYLAFKE